MPKIPSKVVEVVQIDVVQSYGNGDEVNYRSAAKDRKPVVVAAQATTLF